MQERSRKTKTSRNVNVIATRVMAKATDESSIVKNPGVVTLGRLGSLKGDKARAEKLSPEKRVEIARTAALARWGK